MRFGILLEYRVRRGGFLRSMIRPPHDMIPLQDERRTRLHSRTRGVRL